MFKSPFFSVFFLEYSRIKSPFSLVFSTCSSSSFTRSLWISNDSKVCSMKRVLVFLVIIFSTALIIYNMQHELNEIFVVSWHKKRFIKALLPGVFFTFIYACFKVKEKA